MAVISSWSLVISQWFLGGGWKIFAIIASLVGFNFLFRQLIPLVIKKSVKAQMQGRPEVEIKKRIDTLSQNFGVRY